ncbi:MAG: prepilin-type N-terminal cleavage/methylation domain-containing protein [Thiobacillaceae bacterium]
MVKQKAFTLIELLVVMAIVALLLTLITPNYFARLEQAKETTLKHDLASMRDAIDKFHGDRDRYPVNLDELVTLGYLRTLPPDPITGEVNAWKTAPPAEGGESVADIHSSAPGQAKDGTRFEDW